MQKRERQESILEIIELEKIARQGQLVERLIAKGYAVTQASVSRDLVELGVVKVRGSYASPRKAEFSGFGLVKLATAGESMIVARCESGMATAIAMKLDAAEINEIVGTVAGDDTIFIAVENSALQRQAMRKMLDVLSGRNGSSRG